MDLTSITAGEILIVLVAVLFAALFFIKHLITFSYQQQIKVKTKEAELIEKTIQQVVSDFKNQVESLRNDMKNIGNNFRSFQANSTNLIEKLERKTDANTSKADKLEGKLEFIEKHNAELDKKIEEKVKLVFFDTSKA